MNLSIINVSIFGEKEHPNEASVKIVIPNNKIRLAPYFVDAAYIFLGMAMTALGMSVNFKVIKERGMRVFVACFLSSTILMIVCYLIAKFVF